jgi:two-component sensor histidine kinase
MSAKPTSDPATPIPDLDHAPFPLATVEGEAHIVRYINPAFGRLIDKTSDEVVGKPFCELVPENSECLALLDRVYRTGAAAIQTGQEPVGPRPVLPFYTMWPVIADERPVGVMIQVLETRSLYEKTLAINEALMLGSLRQHELTAAADSSNVLLRTEIDEHKQNERDALVLTKEVSHRVKNNLLIIVALIANEIKRTPESYAQGYVAIQTRIAAIAELYDLISQSGRGESVPIDAYLREIARTMSESLIGKTSSITIEVDAEAVDIDHDRAVPFGLLVNELGTNAIKHAFPGGTGRVTLSVKQVGDQIELTVADNGVGMKIKDQKMTPGRHGSDYVAIFVRQLRGTITVSGQPGAGTTVAIRFPLLAVPPSSA